MMPSSFSFLVSFKKNGEFEFDPARGSLAEAVVSASIPYMPGVYLVYELVNGNINRLLYYGKAGTTKSKINGHQLPSRLLATVKVPQQHLSKFKRKKFVTRSKYWPFQMNLDKVKVIRVYWFITWPSDPLIVERQIRKALGKFKPTWHS